MTRKFSSLGLFLFALVALTFLQARPLSAQQEGLLIEGQVVNRSPGATTPVNLTVTLHHESASEHDHIESATDAEGHFKFEMVVPDAFAVYGLSVRYQEALYGTDLSLLEGAPPPVLVEIYESSNDQQILHANSASVLFASADKETQTIAVLEIVQLGNDSDYTYVAGNNAPMDLLRFGLPPGSESLQVDTRLLGADVVQVDRGFAVLAAIPPGNHDIMYTYEFPFTGSEDTFTKSLPFGAEGLRFLSPKEVMTLSGADLGPPEMVTIGDSPYQLIEESDMPRGSRINVTLSDLPQTTFLERAMYTAKTVRPEFLAPALLVALMVVLTGLAIRRHRVRQSRFSETDVALTADETDRFTLLRLISQLEQDYENGDLPAESYQRRRRVLESRLRNEEGS